MRTGELIAGRYRLDDAKGSGSGGIVWTAFDTKLKRTVALKRPHSAVDRLQLQREAEIAAQVQHPNLIAVHDALDDGWLVMEYLDADGLDEVIARGPLPPKRVARIGMQVAAALAAVHARGIVHRDVKPGNVLVTADDLAKLTDFGVSLWREVTGDDGRVSGTPEYVAPEVANGYAANEASDVFSLGATLYAALEGSPPFGSGEAAEVMQRVRDGEIPVPQGPLAPVLADMLQRKPKKRPTAAEVRERLGALVGEWVPPSPGTSSKRSWPTFQLVGVGVLVACVIATTVVVGRPDPVQGSLVGDERTANPCGLMRSDDYLDIGPPELRTDYGNFNRCDVLIDVQRPEKIDVELQLVTITSLRVPESWRTLEQGPFTVKEMPLQNAECGRLVLVDDVYGVRISAKMADSPKNLCTIADIAVRRVRDVLRQGRIPRRATDFPEWSAARADVCALLPPDALPGLNAPQNVFGNWSCKWYTPVSRTNVHVRFDQHWANDSIKGQQTTLDTRYEAYVEFDTDSGHACTVHVPYKPKGEVPPRDVVDVMSLTVQDDRTDAELCPVAEQLATTAARNLHR